MFELINDIDGRRVVGTYKYANRTVKLSTLTSCVHLWSYQYDCSEVENPDFFIRTTAEDVEFEAQKALEEGQLKSLPAPEEFKKFLEMTAVYRKLTELLVDENIFLMHGSAIAVDGEAYLFTAKSGTGKSTHTRLWRERFGERAVMVNDDKPLFELKDGHVTVYGTPWDGKHRLSTNTSVPLKAICVLERGVKNEIERLSAMQAPPMLLQQTHRTDDVEKMLKVLTLVEKTLEFIPVYRLRCNMDPEAAKVAYEGMQNR